MTQATNLYVAAPPCFNIFWGILKTRSHSWIYFSKDSLKSIQSLFSARTLQNRNSVFNSCADITTEAGVVGTTEFCVHSTCPSRWIYSNTEARWSHGVGGILQFIQEALLNAYCHCKKAARTPSEVNSSVFLKCHPSCAGKEVWSCAGRLDRSWGGPQ